VLVLAAGCVTTGPAWKTAYDGAIKSTDQDQKIAGYTRAIEKGAPMPQLANAYNGRGCAYHAKQEWDNALRDFEKTLELDPDYANAHRNCGLVYNVKGWNDRAIQATTRALELNPNWPEAYTDRGNWYRAKGDLDRAVQEYEQAIKVGPHYVWGHRNLAMVYREKGRYADAIAPAAKAIEVKPDCWEAWHERGLAYYHMGQYHRAIRDFRKVVELNPKWAVPYANLGDSYHFGLKDYDLAIQEFTKAIELDANYAYAYNGRGNAYLEKSLYDPAIADYNKALSIMPNDPAYHCNLALPYHRKGMYDEAITHAGKAIKLKPDYAFAFGVRGDAYYGKRDYDKAIKDYTAGIGLDARYAGAYKARGDAYRQQGKYEVAERNYAKALEIRPGWEQVYYSRAWSDFLQGDYRAAIRNYNKTLELKPGYDWALHYRAFAWWHLAEYDKAISDFQAVLALQPRWTYTRMFLAVALRRVGKQAEADRILNEHLNAYAAQHFEDDLVRFLVGKLAESDLTGKAGNSNLLRCDALFLVGMNKLQAGDTAGARQAFTAAIGEADEARFAFILAKCELARLDGVAVATPTVPAPTPAAGPAIKGTRWAVIVGISDYQDKRVPALRYAAADARAFHEWLVDPNAGGYAPVRTRLLLDEAATLSAIKTALFTWLKQAIAEDVVVLYFSGHGSPDSPDTLENLYLLPHDARYDNIAATAFPMWDVETALRRFIKARRIVVIADACHSAGVGRSFDIARRAGRGLKVNRVTEGLRRLAEQGEGTCVISASDDRQLSQEAETWGGGHGVFTHFLLKALRGEADYTRDGIVTLGELIPFVSEQVRRATHSAQCPTVAGKFDPMLTIAR